MNPKKFNTQKNYSFSRKSSYGQNGRRWVKPAATLSKKCQKVFARCPSSITNILFPKKFFKSKKTLNTYNAVSTTPPKRFREQAKNFRSLSGNYSDFFPRENVFFLQFFPRDTSRPVLTTPLKFGQQKREIFLQFVYEK